MRAEHYKRRKPDVSVEMVRGDAHDNEGEENICRKGSEKLRDWLNALDQIDSRDVETFVWRPEDWPEIERKRHLLRLWLSPQGARPLPPVFAECYGGLTIGARGGIICEGTRLHAPLAPG